MIPRFVFCQNLLNKLFAGALVGLGVEGAGAHVALLLLRHQLLAPQLRLDVGALTLKPTFESSLSCFSVKRANQVLPVTKCFQPGFNLHRLRHPALSPASVYAEMLYGVGIVCRCPTSLLMASSMNTFAARARASSQGLTLVHNFSAQPEIPRYPFCH